jgi:hypothetical protein
VYSKEHTSQPCGICRSGKCINYVTI